MGEPVFPPGYCVTFGEPCAEKERELAERYRNERDLDAAWELVTAHLRFVIRIARGYDGYGLAQADLIQEGNIGLMMTVKRFDPNVGVRLVSFAVHWVRAEIHEFILRNWRIVKVATTKAQRKLFFNLRSSRKRLGWMSRAEVEDIAAALGVEPRVVMEMEQRLSAHDASLEGRIRYRVDDGAARPAHDQGAGDAGGDGMEQALDRVATISLTLRCVGP